MKWIVRFGQFWYDFVIGDDWTIALVVVTSVALTALLTHRGWNGWLVLPGCVFGALGGSSWRALRVHRQLRDADEPQNESGGLH